MPVAIEKRAVRIGGISGAVLDRREGMQEMVLGDEEIDALCGDFMSEWSRSKDVRVGQAGLRGGLSHLYFASIGIYREEAYQGACDTERLYHDTMAVIKVQGLSENLTVAWIEGDEVFPQVQAALSDGSSPLVNIYQQSETLAAWKTPIYAQAYLGSMGIAWALDGGADIVLCGRVADASPCMGISAWWHGWFKRPDTHLDELANALCAGHLIECSTYVTGGDFCGFKSLDWAKAGLLGFPIAEVSKNGTVVITKQSHHGGAVNIATCSEQLMYEIQGPLYYNSDVTADLTQASFKEIGIDRVMLSGVKGLPPPATTKVGITAHGGYRAEMHFALAGLDIEAKAKFIELQVRDSLGPDRIQRFQLLKFSVNGAETHDAPSLAACTAYLRIFVQADEADAIAYHNFLAPILDTVMGSCPANTHLSDVRTAHPMAYQEYFSTLFPQASIKQVAHIPTKATAIDIPLPSAFGQYPVQQRVIESQIDLAKLDLGPCTRAPLGYVVHGRAGDKGANANVGFFVRHEDEYEWLKALLSTDSIKRLLRDEYKGGPIDRFEFSGLRAVHFLLANSTLDIFGKMTAEFLRSQIVEIPDKFLMRGRI